MTAPMCCADLFHELGDEPLEQHVVPDVHYHGRCPVTGEELSIGPDALAVTEALRLQRYLDASIGKDDFSSAHLLEPAAGKMFGVLICRDATGRLGSLRAFSGEWDQTWEAPDGWVPSSGQLHEYAEARRETEARVAALTQQIDDLKVMPTSKAIRRQIEMIKIERGDLSRELTDRIHAAYRFDNALGEVLPLTEVDTGGQRPPTGMGDCCAPKLLQAAIRLRLQPVSLVEFWWGSASAMFPRTQGEFYGSCEEKCYPILGFLLRGTAVAQQRPSTRGADL